MYLRKRCCGGGYDWFFPKKDRHAGILVNGNEFFDSAEAFVIPQRITEVLVHVMGGIEQLCYQI
jgi:hypothetical protein